jgi:3-oxoacyl-[acyl-carrier-protein] synthase-3
MTPLQTAYITATGSYLPGPAIGNDEMEAVLGQVHGKPSRLRERILRSNGIQHRHYALDRQQRTTHQNSELAAAAANACLDRAFVDRRDIDLLAVGTTQGDLPLPGLASMVQAELGLPPLEVLTTHGVCSAGVTALKSAVNQVRLGEKRAALVGASEHVSRLLKASHYESVSEDAVDMEAEFLRWMLSDGAGAFLVQPHPRPRGLSLRVDWIELRSFASDFDLCMSCGTPTQTAWGPTSPDGPHGHAERRSWQDYPTYAEAEQHGALLLRQNLRLLENITRVGMEGFLELVQQGRVVPSQIDHFVCHYSSHHFRTRILEYMQLAGGHIPEERWFTNLYEKGNTGCASIFIMLDELFQSDRLQPGQTVFCVVPESVRFSAAYLKLTVVEPAR